MMPRGFGRGFGMRRPGMGLFSMGGIGMGMGSPFLTGLMGGGLGYLLGINKNQQAEQQPVQHLQQTAPANQPSQSATDEKLSQLKLLADLHDRGVLTDEEFISEKNKILNS
jgi:Short C-terminal domain